MTANKLPTLSSHTHFHSELAPQALQNWNSAVKAAHATDNSIAIFDIIGSDAFGEGVTAKRIGTLLQALNGEDVTVNINSPGGDMFEGLAIYNQLKDYRGNVTVKIFGIAASAASIIAMAGDDIQIGRGAFLMIHNCWGVTVGHRQNLIQAAQQMAQFDLAMQDIYATRSGLAVEEIAAMMDNETFISGQEAIKKGLANKLLAVDEIVDHDESPTAALRKIDALLAKTHTPRSERRKLLKAISSYTPGAVAKPTDTPGAVNPETLHQLTAVLHRLAPHL